jgi:acylphosphatase
MAGGSEVRMVRVRIAGRVQGVGYRAWAEDQARGLGLGGWVRNRRDGSVEAVLSGPPKDVAEMLRRCHQGPRSAVVSSVEVTDESGGPPRTFEVWPTV